MEKKGTISMIQTLMIFVIVLAAVMMTGGSLGKKVTDGARDFNIPMPGAYCPGDVGIVDKDTFMKNIQLAAKVAWNGKKACWLKQELDTDSADVTYEDIYDNITDAMNTFAEKETDDCLGGFYSSSGTGPTRSVDWVFWWDDKATCNSNGVFSSTWTWVSGKLGSSQNTLYFYKRDDYCMGGSYINWYNPLGNSNIAKFSQSKGRLNDANICRDETKSGGLDYSLPKVVDLTIDDFNDQKNIIHNGIKTCVQNYETQYLGGYWGSDGEKDNANIYLICNETYKIKLDADKDISELFSENNYDHTIHDPSYTESNYDFKYTDAECDILNSNFDGPNYDEFNSVTWNKDSTGWTCIYILKNMLIQTSNEILNTANEDGYKLKKDSIYEINAFYYFESGSSTSTGYNDIIITIDIA